MSQKFSFTKPALDNLPIPEKGKRLRVFDTRCPGLALQVMGSGNKAFYVYRWVEGQPKQVKIGPFPDLSIEQARDKAREILGSLALGEDPVAEKRKARAEMTFGELFDWYLEHHAKVRKKSWGRDKWQYELHLQSLAKLKLSQITRAQIREIHARLGKDSGIYAANRVLALIRTVFNKAIAHELTTLANPASSVTAFREQSRDRRLNTTEIPRFFEALEKHGSQDLWDYVYLSLFTGARQANVLAMSFDDIDLQARTWRIPETKNGTPQVIPLEDTEVEILTRREAKAKGPWVFPGKGKKVGHLTKPPVGWDTVLREAKVSDFRFHDLRRTLGSWMADTGASLPVIGKALHHMSQSTTAVYARLSLDPVREAKSKAISAMLARRTTKEDESA
jgi:integrase